MTRRSGRSKALSRALTYLVVRPREQIHGFGRAPKQAPARNRRAHRGPLVIARPLTTRVPACGSPHDRGARVRRRRRLALDRLRRDDGRSQAAGGRQRARGAGPAEGARMILEYGDVSGDRREQVDVIIIGSGCGGATVAKELAAAGRSVLILERGG